MELYHKITKEVLELLLKEGAQMPVDLGRKLQRSSSNMQQVREYLSDIGCIHVTKKRNFYELKITEKGTILLEVMRQMEKLDKPGQQSPLNMPKIQPSSIPKKEINHDIKIPEEPKPSKLLNPTEEVIKRGGRTGVLKRF